MTTRRARDTAAKLSRRRQLLEAAAACLDAAGYAATTMSEIAIAAGLAKGTTYLYFRSKEELFLELVATHPVSLKAGGKLFSEQAQKKYC